MKGYFVPSGYMGWIASANAYRLFATDTDYLEFVAAN